MKGWRTIIFQLLVAVFAALESMDFTSVLNSETAPVVLLVVAAINAVLRAVTTTPLGKKDK